MSNEQSISTYESERYFGIVAEPPIMGPKVKFLQRLKGVDVKYIGVYGARQQVFVYDRLGFGFSDASIKKDTSRRDVFRGAVQRAVVNIGDVNLDLGFHDFSPIETSLSEELNALDRQPLTSLADSEKGT